MFFELIEQGVSVAGSTATSQGECDEYAEIT